MTDKTLDRIFKDDVLPFLRSITHHLVRASTLLEKHLNEIYPVVFGAGGTRAEMLTAAAVRYVTGLPTANDLDQVNLAVALEATLSVLLQITEFNTAARAMPCFQEHATVLGSLIPSESSPLSSELFAQSAKHLDRISKRLGIGHEIPALQKRAPATGSGMKTTFTLQRAGPGHLSNGQPRHDNDFFSIDDIRILPTYQEIMSLHNEYLPLRDPESWHKPGLEGLVDRHFRLLREDTIGQLRDAARVELQALQAKFSGMANNTPKRKDVMRTFTYHNVRVELPNFDIHDGLQFAISFDQPQHLQKLSPKQRQDWWQHSKRLEGDALICLLGSSGEVVFCTVCHAPSDRRRAADKQDNNGLKAEPQEGLTPWDDDKRGNVMARPANMDKQSINDLLDTFSRGTYFGARSLVEFPGVLLPSFLQTLTAMQSLAKNLDMPFSEFIAPRSNSSSSDDRQLYVPPPAYSQKSGFSFDLSQICNVGEGMSFNPKEIKNTDIAALEAASALDESQSAAVLNSLSRRLALIQGPPGTGKSYTGIALIKTLLANKEAGKLGPILCVCYTNHALDQLLEHLLNKGVGQIIRIGSRSKSERLSELNLRKVAMKMDQTKQEGRDRWNLKSEMESEAKSIVKLLTFMSKAETVTSVKRYLDLSNPRHSSELFGHESEDGFKEVKHQNIGKVLHRWMFEGKDGPGASNRGVNDLQSIKLQSMSRVERQRLHDHWISHILQPSLDELQDNIKAYNKIKRDFDRVRNELDLRVLNEADVIGITTTGLARNLDLLRKLPSKVLVVEEAGEVLESHLITALLPSAEHVILIGDQLQLRPHVQNYKLSLESPEGQQYAMDLSLFERLVEPMGENDIQLPFTRLETQRRMHPSIAELVRRPLYPSLIDASPEYPEVPGMKKRLYWFDHNNREVSHEDGSVATSQTNDFEVDMTLALVSHLVKQGTYHAEDIAVLTPYLGQLRKLRNRMSNTFEVVLGERDAAELERENEALAITTSTVSQTPARRATLAQALRIATVDNFQGDEAAVIVVSLVRCNENQRCGFLKTSNRINVLLSRAKHGMYIIGNSTTSQHISMWGQVLSILREGGNIGSSIEIQCPRHPETSMEVRSPDDFLAHAPDGGCKLSCVQRLKCGHACPGKCHSEILHDAVHCLVPCPRPMEGCTHSCPKACGDLCPQRCRKEVVAHVGLPCGHTLEALPCWLYQHQDMIHCDILVKKDVPGCGHEVTVSCHIDVNGENFSCPAKCGAASACGHICERACSKCNTRGDGKVVVSDHGQCTKPCEKPFTGCAHTCPKKCHPGRPCELCKLPCSVKCSHSSCDKKCSEPCVPCAEDRCSSGCPHSRCTMPCAAPCDWVACSLRCEKQLACGHRCPSLCGAPCPIVAFCQICGPSVIKDKEVDFIMGETYAEIDLDANPCIFPSCGHFYTVESMDGHVGMSDHYELDKNGFPTALKAPTDTLDFKKDHIVCPICRRSLRDIPRYGRPVRQALLIESTLKFITWSNAMYVPLAKLFFDKQKRLQDTAEHVRASLGSLNLAGQAGVQIINIAKMPGASRYAETIDLHYKIRNFVAKVRQSEQPFKRVQDLVMSARNRHRTVTEFKVDPSFLQTRAHIMATALLLRCDLAVLSDVLLLRSARAYQMETTVDFSTNRQDCEELGRAAEKGDNILQLVESLLFWVRFASLELSWESAIASDNESDDEYEWE